MISAGIAAEYTPAMRRRWPLAVLLGLAVILAGTWGWASYQGSASGLEGRKGRLAGVRLTGAGGDAVSTFEDLTLRSSTGQAVRAIIREGSRPDAEQTVAALTGRLRDVTDEFLARENRDRPDALEDILSPTLAPDDPTF